MSLETSRMYTNVIADGAKRKNRVYWYVGIIDHLAIRELEWCLFQPRQTRFQEFYEGDVVLAGQVWSDEISVDIHKSTNPFRKPINTRVKVVRRFQNARIYPNYESTVTIVTIEPEAREDRATVCLVIWGYQSWPMDVSLWINIPMTE
ncbi:hypothetical protein PQX77_021994 [Marasmius sp. AFHP31]|nr:hypothetical protein PQX77_021994 [Marasmius sp. AFHP31]